MRTLCFTCVFALLKNVPTTRWKKFRLRSAPSLNHRCQQPLQWFWRHCRRTQSHRWHPARSTAETFELNPFQPCATHICLPKDIAKEQGHGKTSYKVFSQNPLYQIEEDVGKISFNKSWGINMQQILRNKYASVLRIKHLLLSKEHGNGTGKRQRNNMF